MIGAFGTVTKGLLKGLEDLEVGGRAETIQITTLLRTTRILGRVLETCCQSDACERPSAKTDGKNSLEIIINNDNNRLGKKNRRVENQRTCRDQPNDSIIKIGQNTEKSPGDLGRLAVPQTSLKNYQLCRYE